MLTVFASGLDSQAQEEVFQTFDWTPQHYSLQVKSLVPLKLVKYIILNMRNFSLLKVDDEKLTNF